MSEAEDPGDPMDSLSRTVSLLQVLRRMAPEHRLQALQDAARMLGGAVEAKTPAAGEVERLRAALEQVRALVPTFHAHAANGRSSCVWCRALGIIQDAIGPEPTKAGAPE